MRVSVEYLRDLIDVVSVANEAENTQSTKFTSRAKLDKVLSFHGRTGRWSSLRFAAIKVPVSLRLIFSPAHGA
jgi:hypothetical protein